MPEPLTFVHSKSDSVKPPLACHGEHLACEGLVQFDQINVGQLETGQLERLDRGRHRDNAHRVRKATPPTPDCVRAEQLGEEEQVIRKRETRIASRGELAVGVSIGSLAHGVVGLEPRAEGATERGQ
jgi:hypothetical protein